MNTIIDHSTYPIKPSQIDATGQIMESFDRYEPEISATWIVEFCQERDTWEPFTLEELETYYHTHGRPDETFLFNGLDTNGFLVLQDGKYHITHEFISRCYRAAPAL